MLTPCVSVRGATRSEMYLRWYDIIDLYLHCIIYFSSYGIIDLF